MHRASFTDNAKVVPGYTSDQLAEMPLADVLKHTLALQTELAKLHTSISGDQGKPAIRKRARIQAPLDFGKYESRWIALRVAYDGAVYHGMSSQQGIGRDSLYDPTRITDKNRTVEDCLFAALMKTKLIEAVNDCGYSRCGRTDAGVSAVGQVVGVKVRGPKRATPVGDKQDELPYVAILNRALPEDIRVLAWAHAPDAFHARFDCQWREYCYFFARGTLNVEAMQEAAAMLVGTHDFRNFSCRDASKAEGYSQTRHILCASIRACHEARVASGLDMYRLGIRGNAFLYHQIRCTMGILFLVGHGLEPPSVVRRMLDLHLTPTKPCYEMASETPLVLSSCGYPDGLLRWAHVDRDNEENCRRERLAAGYQLFERYEQRASQALALRAALELEEMPAEGRPPSHQRICID